MNKTKSGMRFSQQLKMVLFSTAILLLANAVQAANYYVSPSGSNSNKGLSESGSFKTVNYAAQIATAGDTVFVLPGSYNEQVIIKNSGQPGKYLVIRGVGVTKPVIDGTGISLAGTYQTGGVIKAVSKSYLVIENLEIRNSSYFGIMISGPASKDITLRNIRTYKTIYSGIYCSGNSSSDYTGINTLLIEDCEIDNSHYSAGSGYEECLSISNGCSDIIIRRNHVHHAGKGSNRGGPVGIDVKFGIKNAEIYNNTVNDISNATGIYCDGWTRTNENIKIYNNLIYTIFDQGISIGAESDGYLNNVSVYNNVVYNCGYAGISVPDYGHAKNHITGIKIYNNTFYNNGLEAYGGISISDQTADVIVKNNIVANKKGYQIYSQYMNPNVKVSHNVFFGPGTTIDYGNYVIVTDPQFVDAAKGNFKLKATSPAINRALDTLDLVSDFDALARPVGSGPDIGAFEYADVVATSPWPAGSDTLYAGSAANQVLKDPYPVNPTLNLIKNGNFESGATLTSPWENWGGSVVSTKQSVSATHSLELTTGSGGGGAAYIITGIQQDIDYVFKMNVKMTDPAWQDPNSGYAKVGIGIIFKSKSGKQIPVEGATADVKMQNGTPATNWTPYTINITAPEYAYRMELYVWGSSTSAPTYTDNWELYAVGGERTIITGIEQERAKENDFASFYPNPLKDKLTITFNGVIPNACSVEIFNLQGKLIYSASGIRTKQLDVDLSDQPVGHYIVKLSNGELVLRYKIVKI